MSTTARPAPSVVESDDAPGAHSHAHAEGGEHGAHAHHGYISDQAAYLNRMKRIQGQVRGVSRMIEDESYCIDILTQISAASSALQAVARGLLDDHLAHCVVDAARQGPEEARDKLAEVSAALARLVR